MQVEDSVAKLFQFVMDYQKENFFCVLSVVIPMQMFVDFMRLCDGIYIYHPDSTAKDILKVFGIMVKAGNVEEIIVKETSDK